MTTLQKLLLQAAHGPAQEAHLAWATWRRSVIWDEIDADSYYLLPALYRALERLDIDDPWRPRLAGIHRKTWYSNQLLRQTTVCALQALACSGVSLVLSAAPALVYFFQEDCGLHPLNSLQCFITREQQEIAGRLLRDAGWLKVVTTSTRIRNLVRAPAPVAVYVADNGSQLTLWWKLNQLSSDVFNEFIDNAVEVTWSDTTIKAVTLADALRQIFKQAAYGNEFQRESDTLLLKQLLK